MKTNSYAWLDGRILEMDAARVSITDRGFTLADGVFETIMAVDGRPLWLSEHLLRLRESANCLQIPLRWDESEIERVIQDLLEKSAGKRNVLRITLTRGPTNERGLYSIAQQSTPTTLITVSSWKAPVEQQVIVSTCTRRNEHSPLARIKSLNYGDNLLAKQEALRRGATDALMINGAGNISCATVGNVFLLIEGEWRTPSLACGILPGLARKRLIELLSADEAALPVECVSHASAGIISNSLGCSLIGSIDGRVLAVPPRWEDVESIYVD